MFRCENHADRRGRLRCHSAASAKSALSLRLDNVILGSSAKLRSATQ